MDKYERLLDVLNRLRKMDLPNKGELYDNIVDIENNERQKVSQLEPPVIVKLADIETEDYVLKNTTRGSYWLENKEFGEGLEVYHKELNDLLGDYFKKWF